MNLLCFLSVIGTRNKAALNNDIVQMKFCDFLWSRIDPDVSLSQSLQMKASGQSGVPGALGSVRRVQTSPRDTVGQGPSETLQNYNYSVPK